MSRSRSISEQSKSTEKQPPSEKVRACVYGPRSLGGGVSQKGWGKPLPMRPDTSRSRGRKIPSKSRVKTGCFEKTADVCGTPAQFFIGSGSPNATNPLRKWSNTYRTQSITENTHTGRSGWRKTPRHRRRPAHRCDRRLRCPGWKAAPAPGSTGRHPPPPDL